MAITSKPTNQAARLLELRQEHRDLDEVIDRLQLDPITDQLLLHRLKLKKLRLKDEITRLQSARIPDLGA